MKNLFKIAFSIIASLVILAGRADAAVLNSQYISEKIKKDITEQISSIVSGEVVVEVKSIPYKTITVPDGDVQVIASTNLTHFSSVTVVRVSILVNGEEEKAFGVPVSLSVWDKVWVAKDFINRGDALTSTNAVLERKEVGLLAADAARDNFYPQNNLVRKIFRPGDVIDLRYVESTPDVLKNNLVSVIFKTSSISVTVPAEALDNGKIGDFVRVRSKAYKKDYTGKVISTNTILVSL